MKKLDALAIGIFAAVIGVFFYPTIIGGKLPIPSDALVGLYHPWRDYYASTNPRGVPFKNFLTTDPVRQQIPWRKAAVDQWKDAKLPWWNPYGFSGTPLAANIQAAVFYPLNILFFILPFPVAWTVLVMLQPVLGGLFFFMYLRSLKLGAWASLLGSITWSFGGFSIAWLTWGTMGHVMAWFPLILLAIDQVIKGERRKQWTLVFGCSLAMSLFAGHSQIFFYALLFSIGYALWRLAGQSAQVRRESRKWLLIGFFASAVVTSIQWVPFLSFLPVTSRFAELDVWKKAGWFIPWRHLIQFLAPDFFGNPTTLNYWGEWNYAEFVGYIGIIPLVFALGALKAKEMRFWTWVLVISLLFALPTSIAKLPYALKIPILSSLQPTRLLSIATFALAVLAAFGLDAWQKRNKRLWWPSIVPALLFVGLWSMIFLGPGIAAVSSENLAIAKRNLVLSTALLGVGSIIYLFFSLKRFQLFGVLAILVLSAFDLLRFGWKFTPFTSQAYFFPTTQAIEFLQKQPKPFRIASLDSRVLPPNASAYYRLESIEGYDPLYLGDYEKFIVSSERGTADTKPPYGFNRIITPHNIDSSMWPLLGARFVLSLTDIERPYLKHVFREGETRIYEDLRAVPRAYLVESVIAEPDRQKALEHLLDARQDPTRTAVIEKTQSLLAVPLAPEEFVMVKSYEQGALILDVEAINPRLLVVTNIFSSGWQAFIDGTKIQIYRTNYLFQGIIVPPGHHTVHLRYR